MPARAERADLRRRHLLATARQLFVQHGFHAAGVAQIAKASGIRVGQIYRDFASKEDIIAAIVEEDVATFLEEDELAEAVAAGDLPAIRDWIGRFGSVEEAPEECRLMAEIFAEAARNPRIAEVNRVVDAKVRSTLLAALAALVPHDARAEGRAALADFILALGAGLMTRRAVDPAAPIDALLRHAAAIVSREIDALASGTADVGG